MASEERKPESAAAALASILETVTQVLESQVRVEETRQDLEEAMHLIAREMKKTSEGQKGTVAELTQHGSLLGEMQKKQSDQRGLSNRNSEVLNGWLKSIDGHMDKVSQTMTVMDKRLKSEVAGKVYFWGFLPKSWVLWTAILIFGVLFGRIWSLMNDRDVLIDERERTLSASPGSSGSGQCDQKPNEIEEMVLARWNKATKNEKNLISKLLLDEKMSAAEAKKLDRFLSVRKKVSKAPKKGKRR